MGCIRHIFLAGFALLAVSDARKLAHHKHEAADVKVRRQGNSPAQVPAVPTQPPVLTTVYPSPGASPLNITEQSQIFTSFVPQFTLCELPPNAAFPVTTSVPTSPPYLNYSISPGSGTGTCTTIYSPTPSMVCATQLTDLTTTYTVSQCNQDITFSTEYGYTLVTPSPTTSSGAATASPILITPAPSVQTITTYFLAPWQDLTSAGPPGDVDYKICTGFPNGSESCVLEYYQWRTSLLTLSSVVTTSINITTTIPGPSQLIVETFVANVTGTATAFSMSTTMELETSTLSETTQSSTRALSTATSTVYLEYASQASTRTTTIHTTLTTTVGTSTVTLTTSIPSVSGVAAQSLPAANTAIPASIPSTILSSLAASVATDLPAAPASTLSSVLGPLA